MQLYFNDQSLLFLCTSLVTTPTKTTPYIVYHFTYIVKIAAPFKIEIKTNRITKKKNIFISTFQGTFKQVNKPRCNLATLWGNVINIFETTQCSLFFRFQQSIHSIFNTWNILMIEVLMMQISWTQLKTGVDWGHE